MERLGDCAASESTTHVTEPAPPMPASMLGPRHGRWQAAVLAGCTLAAMVAIGAASRLVPWPERGRPAAGHQVRAATSMPAAGRPRSGGVAAGTAARADQARLLAGARLRELWLAGPDQQVPRSPVDVYLPAGYGDPANAHRAYPVVYLLHGYPADQ